MTTTTDPQPIRRGGMSSRAYLAALAGGAIFWIVVAQAIHAHLPEPESIIFYILVALTWNAVSFRRIGKSYAYHLGPYATIVALIGLTWGLSASEGQYAFGGHPPTLLDAIIFYASLPLALVWPVVTVILCVRRGSR